MKAILILFPLLISLNSQAHKLPPEVQTIVAEAMALDEDVKRGKKLYNRNCMACHGQKGIPRNMRRTTYPYLADQAPKYLLIHMAMFKTKHRVNTVMNNIAQNLKTQDMTDIKAYLVSDEARAVHCETLKEDEAFRGDIEAGRILAETKRDFTRRDGSVVGISCTMCHGDNGLMPEEYREQTMHPDLAGQSARYLYQQFIAFKKNERVNAGPMNLMVKDLNNKQLRDLSAYYASLSRCR